MRIIELILHRYTRLAFSEIETIHYKPTEDVQIIIGTNGSGKSSLLAELNPLPVNKAYMLDGGYKTIRIEHRGCEYTLHSKYGKHHKHSFIEHGENGDKELNDGGTAAAQKILIEKVFGLNVELLKIWLGKTKFTELSPVKRRDWILRLSGNDLDHAMRVFQTTKNEHRDALALERHFIQRLASETADIADQNRISELEETVKALTVELNGLLEQRDNKIPSLAVLRNEIDRLSEELRTKANDILRVRVSKPKFMDDSIRSLEALRQFISNQATRVESLKAQLDDLYQQKKTINTALETLNTNGVHSTKELIDVTDTMRKEIDALIEVTPIYRSLGELDPHQLMGRYQACKPLLVETLAVMTDNSSGYFSKDKFDRANRKVNEISMLIETLKKRLIELQHHLDHYNNLNDEACPKCNHLFKPGMQGFSPRDAELEVINLKTQLEELQQRLKDGKLYCEEATEYRRQVASLKRIINDNPELESLWTLLVKEDLYKVHPQSHLPTIQNFAAYIENCIGIKQLYEKINLNEAVLTSISSNNEGQSNFSDQHIKYLDQKIDELIKQISEINAVGRESSIYLKEMSRIQSNAARVKEIQDTLIEKYDLLIRSGINKTISDVIHTKQIRLAEHNNALTKITRHDAVIQEVKSQKENATANLRNYNVLLKTLSPVDGLISKYIQNFLDVFIEDVNLEIAEIWTSPMEVLSCGVDSNDVTCKFPLSICDGYFITPDISEASDGQIDIINFAFRMAVAKYLDLHDYPLYLDELAPTLDEQHRENITRYVNNLMETKQFEQMFMISHYAANHYAFANSEILMMDGRNIINKPGAFNTHVKITTRSGMIPDKDVA